MSTSFVTRQLYLHHMTCLDQSFPLDYSIIITDALGDDIRFVMYEAV